MLNKGETAIMSMRVNESDLAAAYSDPGTQAYPAVLSSPAMLGLMERACARLLVPHLKNGEMSVGVKAEFSHFEPTPLGAVVCAEATFDQKEGALYWFHITVKDNGGSVGKGRHARAIVKQSDIEEKAASRSSFVNV
jgi:fluoroacetyl-CoA thioesterase